MLLLVRHAMPTLSEVTPPELWELDATGRSAAALLAGLLPTAALLVSSEEPKARQTLEPAGDVLTDPRFNEVTRDEPYAGDYRSRRRAYLAGADHPTWEPRPQVIERFDAGITHWTARAAGRPLVVATHGMALTLWLATVADLPDPAAFWSGLGLPDLFEVDAATRTATRRLAGS
jgi:broad specificity phosphatase PhoE